MAVEVVGSALLEAFIQVLTERILKPHASQISEIERLRNELGLLNQSIEEADGSLDGEDSVKMYVRQMRDVANLIEYILDEYDLLASSSQHGYLMRAAFLISKLNRRRDLARNIDNIKALLVDIRENGERYGIRDRVSVDDGLYQYHGLVVSVPREEILVGMDPAVDGGLMKKHLLGGEPRRSAVAVLGGGGIGKTTLAARVYHREEVMAHFDLRAWIAVPHGLHEKDEILRLTARQVVVRWQENEGMRVEVLSRDELVNAVRQSLRAKRYLLVFDNVWREEFWHVVRDALPDHRTGSRVILTTRTEAVAFSCKEAQSDHVHRMKPLSEEASRELFCRIAFRHGTAGGRFPEELRQLSVEILGMCEGLPLAIMAIAHLLSTKGNSPLEWRRLLENFSLEDDASLVALSKIIALSFDDLPQRLKKCFMYFSVFPKELPIRSEKLLKLWIAEGFVQEKGGKTLEEVSEEYLNELINRNLVEACEGFYGIEKFCRVHNLMHEILQKKASNRDFCTVRDGKICRRLMISSAHSLEKVLGSDKDSQVRSVFVWNTGPLNNSVFVRLFQKYYLLTMLDIENSPLEILPNEVGNLSCLKYLSLKNTKVKELPKTVRKLKQLQTLDLSGSLLVELPMEIAKLDGLRHLQASRRDKNIRSLDSAKGVKIKAGIGALANLQTLATVDANLSGADVIQELKRLKELRNLSVSRLSSDLSNAVCACIGEMTQLESLRLHSMKNEILELQSVSSPPTWLERLVLKGNLRSLPDWIFRLDNLRMMCLSLSSLADNPFHYLCGLPNLESLWLYGSYNGAQLVFEDGDFRKLRLLVLREMQGVEAVEIEEGTMPLLEELRIGPSPLLNEVPTGIVFLRSLKVVSFYDMPDEFVLSLQPDGGSEFWKVEHVPSVLFWYRNGAEQSYESYQLAELELLQRLGGLDANTDGVDRKNSSWLSFFYGTDNDEDEGETASASNFDISQSSLSSDLSSFSSSNHRGETASTLNFQWNDNARFKFFNRRNSRLSFSYSTDGEGGDTASTSSFRQTSFASDRLSFFSDDIED